MLKNRLEIWQLNESYTCRYTKVEILSRYCYTNDNMVLPFNMGRNVIV